jgi:putative phosphoesterase
MKVGVLSDTHIPSKAKALPVEVIQAFREVDHIIHAGDITSMDVLDTLKGLAPVTAVSGNIDSDPVWAALNRKEIIVLNGYRIGVVHGDGKSGKTLDRVIKCFNHDDVDCIIFGHSHIPYCEQIDNVLLFNPGSPTDKRRNKFFTFGIIELENGIRAKHICF